MEDIYEERNRFCEFLDAIRRNKNVRKQIEGKPIDVLIDAAISTMYKTVPSNVQDWNDACLSATATVDMIRSSVDADMVGLSTYRDAVWQLVSCASVALDNIRDMAQKTCHENNPSDR